MREHRGTEDPSGGISPDSTLLEVANRELWQLELISRGDCVCGRIIRQLVEPSMYTIRYLIVYDKRSGHHIPVPANTITDITEKGVFCDIDAVKFLSLPNLTDSLDRTQEEQIHSILAQTPYWIEEASTDNYSQGTETHQNQDP
ncbi:MAG: hypothetical protein GX977_03950 [Firmicutes bacterium]|nr:hypothetical protein [Bacillota bacterium]